MAVGAALALAPVRARADKPEAAALLEQGKNFYAKEDYTRAVGAFEEAVELVPTFPNIACGWAALTAGARRTPANGNSSRR